MHPRLCGPHPKCSWVSRISIASWPAKLTPLQRKQYAISATKPLAPHPRVRSSTDQSRSLIDAARNWLHCSLLLSCCECWCVRHSSELVNVGLHGSGDEVIEAANEAAVKLVLGVACRGGGETASWGSGAIRNYSKLCKLVK